MLILNATLMVLVAAAIVSLLGYAVFTSVDRSHVTMAGSADIVTLPAPDAEAHLRQAA